MFPWLQALERADTTVAETRILFDGVAAPLIYVSGGQSSAIVPYAVAGKTSTQVQIEYRGVRSAPVTVAVADAAPALFSANSSGKGPGAIFNQDMSVNAQANPAEKRSVVTLYGTGEGQTTPAGADGKLAADVLPKPRLPVSVTICGQTADVQNAGAAPGLVAGVFQINVTVPAGIDSGDSPVVVTIGSASSQTGLTLAVK
jgi:uncharacterized protein (TIGR03437 family)